MGTTIEVAPPLGRVHGLLVRYRQFLTYVAIGGGAVLLDVGIFWLLAGPLNVDPLIANAISVSIALVYSFLANTFINFRVWSRLFLRFLSFSVVSGIGFVVSSAMLIVLSGMFGMDAMLVKVLSLPVVLVLQFTLNTRITFATTAPTRGIPA